VTITNYPDGTVEWLESPYWPRDIGKEGSRKVPLSREIFIERTDFSEHPPADWMRLHSGGDVRLMSGYIINCEEIVKDPATGDVVELRCSYDPDSLGKTPSVKRKRTTAIHWVSGAHAVAAEVRLYDRLFSVPDPEEAEGGKTFKDCLNPDSTVTLRGCLLEPGLAGTPPGERFQFLRHGYFIADAVDSKPDALVFNRIVALKDTYKGGKTAPQAAQKVLKQKPG
jgi:glutaminyl-tRNA synthetase